MFPDIAYIDWISGRPERAEFDLGTSDLRREPAATGEFAPPALASAADPAPEMTVEALLADEYDVALENVLVTAGATHANFLAVAAALDIADDAQVADGEERESTRVLVEKPGYEPLLATPRGLGATVDRFRRPAEDHYSLDPDRVGAALTENVVCAAVTNRHNPSGRRVERQTLGEIAEHAVDADSRLLVDEVYAPFGADPTDGPFGGPSAAGLPNTVVTNSLTKFFGFDGLRIGWLVADESFVERARTVGYHLPIVSEPSRHLARRALAGSSELAREARDRVAANRELLSEFVAGRDDLSGEVSPGSTYAFLAHDHATGDDVATAAWDRGVLVVPGRFFDDDARFRVSVSGDTATVRAGLEQFGEALDALAER